MPQISRIVYEVLSQIGSHREAQYYFDLFSRDDAMRFALITLSETIINQAADKLVSALGLLYHLGLTPVVVHEANVDNGQLVKLLNDKQIQAVGITHKNFDHHVDLGQIKQAVNQQQLPIVTCPTKKMDVLISRLGKAIQPHKIIFLTQSSGLTDQDGRIISTINLNPKPNDTQSPHTMSCDLPLTLKQICQLLYQLPAYSSVSVTSVSSLAKELFTYSGAGTIIRIEEQIKVCHYFDQQLEQQLSNLIETSFEQKLKPEYFKQISLDKLFISYSGTAMAVVLKNSNSIPYLDKFVVTPQAQGIGLGKVIWKTLSQHYEKLFWRARVNNPVNPWYLRQATCSKRQGEWIVFGKNIDDNDWSDCVRDALTRTIYMA